MRDWDARPRGGAGFWFVKALCWLVSQALRSHLVTQQVRFLTWDPVGLMQLFSRS